MRLLLVLLAAAGLGAPAVAQSVPYQYLLEVSMNTAAEKAGWQWTDARQAFNTAGAGNGFAMSIDVEAGKSYLLSAACAKPCTRVALRLMTADQQPVGDIVWGETSGEIQLATLAYTAPATEKLLLVTAIAECPEATCSGSASFNSTRLTN